MISIGIQIVITIISLGLAFIANYLSIDFTKYPSGSNFGVSFLNMLNNDRQYWLNIFAPFVLYLISLGSIFVIFIKNLRTIFRTGQEIKASMLFAIIHIAVFCAVVLLSKNFLVHVAAGMIVVYSLVWLFFGSHENKKSY